MHEEQDSDSCGVSIVVHLGNKFRDFLGIASSARNAGGVEELAIGDEETKIRKELFGEVSFVNDGNVVVELFVVVEGSELLDERVEAVTKSESFAETDREEIDFRADVVDDGMNQARTGFERSDVELLEIVSEFSTGGAVLASSNVGTAGVVVEYFRSAATTDEVAVVVGASLDVGSRKCCCR